MVLVDTSAWLRALASKQPYRNEVDALLDAELVVRHDLVYGELLIGDNGGRAKMLANYLAFQRIETVAHSEVVALVRSQRLFGTGLSWIDVQLLAAALVNRAQLYTADQPLRASARALGVLHEPS
jgi:predicted nucleic acid-binding protein